MKYKEGSWLKVCSLFFIALGMLLFAGYASAATIDYLQPAAITYNEDLTVNATGRFDSIYIGKQGIGGVTFFNGTIINSTIDVNTGAPIPVTFGDDVRIDGAIWRGPRKGDAIDNMPLKIADSVMPALDDINDFGKNNYRWRNGYFSNTVWMDKLGGENVVTSENLHATNDPASGNLLAYDNNGKFQWVDANDADWIGAGSGKMYANDINDNVGIGTTDPEFKLTLDNGGGIIARGQYLFSGPTLNTSGSGTRFIWYPKKAAIRAGRVSGVNWDDAYIGNYSVAFGYNTRAFGTTSTAIGWSAKALGSYSLAIGQNAETSGSDSIALGHDTTASNSRTVAIGWNTTASNIGSMALGGSTVSSGSYSVAMGLYTTASGNSSTAMGESTIASGLYSLAMGESTTASGLHSLAIGRETTASGNNSLTIGHGIQASGLYTVAIALNDQSGTDISQDNSLVILGGKVGIGEETPDTTLEVKSVIKSTPTDIPGVCNASSEGGMYYDASLDEPCYCDGSNWKQFDGGGNC